jgi:hypothetical protein
VILPIAKIYRHTNCKKMVSSTQNKISLPPRKPIFRPNFTTAKKTNTPPSHPAIWGLDFYIVFRNHSRHYLHNFPWISSSPRVHLPHRCQAVDPATFPRRLHQKAKIPPGNRSTQSSQKSEGNLLWLRSRLRSRNGVGRLGRGPGWGRRWSGWWGWRVPWATAPHVQLSLLGRAEYGFRAWSFE